MWIPLTFGVLGSCTLGSVRIFSTGFFFHVYSYLCLKYPHRYCQPPNDFWSWYEPYFDDEEVNYLPKREIHWHVSVHFVPF